MLVWDVKLKGISVKSKARERPFDLIRWILLKDCIVETNCDDFISYTQCITSDMLVSGVQVQISQHVNQCFFELFTQKTSAVFCPE